MHSNEGMLSLNERQKKYFVKNTVDHFYNVIGTLEKGKYSVIRKLVHKKTGIAYAAKHIKKQKATTNLLPSIHHEIAILELCKSKRTLGLQEVFETASHVTLILEYLAGGDLQCVLDKKEFLSEMDAKLVVNQVLESLSVMHAQKIAHMNIKPQNILMSKTNCYENIKLCDFSISKCLELDNVVRTMTGTLDYIAPEVLGHDPITVKADVWSVGVLTYVLLCGYTPFGVESKQQTFLNIMKGNFDFVEKMFDSISLEGINFIRSSLILDPMLRPSVEDLLQHVWFFSGKSIN